MIGLQKHFLNTSSAVIIDGMIDESLFWNSIEPPVTRSARGSRKGKFTSFYFHFAAVKNDDYPLE